MAGERRNLDYSRGRNDNVRHDVEVQCAAAGNLLKHSRRWRLGFRNPTQCWLAFLAETDERRDVFLAVGDQGRREVTDRRIDVLTIASERACRACAAREHPAPVR